MVPPGGCAEDVGGKNYIHGFSKYQGTFLGELFFALGSWVGFSDLQMHSFPEVFCSGVEYMVVFFAKFGAPEIVLGS